MLAEPLVCARCGYNPTYEDSKCCVACINEEHGLMFDALMLICENESYRCPCSDNKHEDACTFNMANKALEEIR